MRSPRVAAYTFEIVLDEPLSIADPQALGLRERLGAVASEGAEDSQAPRIPVTADPWGAPIVRGTAVFGPLRAHFARYPLRDARQVALKTISSAGATRDNHSFQPASLADLVCGSLPEELESTVEPMTGAQEVGTKRALRPSALRVIGTSLTAPGPASGGHRTAINRRTGTGEVSKLFGRDALDDARIEVTLTLDLDILAEAIHDLWPAAAQRPATPNGVIGALSAALSAWSPSLGGQRSIGFGSARTDRLRCGMQDPIPLRTLVAAKDTVSLFREIADDIPSPSKELLVCDPPPDNDRWRLTVPLRTCDPLLISPTVRTSADGHSNVRESARVITGATWKGVIRSRAEFILRTCDIYACESSTETCRECPTCVLFGSSPGDLAADPSHSGSPGLVRFGNSAITGEDRPLVLNHVAIDRFTGGAAEAKLFASSGPRLGSTCTLEVVQRDPDQPVPTWASALLILAIRDLVEGYVGVGSSTTRGYGTVAAVGLLPTVPPRWLSNLKDSLHTRPYAQESP
jgi:hypothetical protein